MMTKTYRMKNLGCASCGAKMERAIKKLDGVSNASINFMTQKLTLEADETKLDTIVPEMQKAVKKFESEAEIIV